MEQKLPKSNMKLNVIIKKYAVKKMVNTMEKTDLK